MWRTGRFIAACAVLAMVGVQTARAVTIRADLYDGDNLSLRLGASSRYASVGEFSGSTGDFDFVASGTLIAPDWVLTAAHVLDDTTALNFSIGESIYSAASWTSHADWTGNLLAGYDIGLVHLSSPVNVTPATLYTGRSELGQAATFVGYGMTGTGVTGATTLDGQKRAAQNVIDGRLNSSLLFSDFDNPNFRWDNSLGSSKPLTLEGLIAPGDSGGGVFITTRAGTFLAGINSFAAAWDGSADSDYGDLSGYTRVSAFTSWINSVIGDEMSSASGSYLANAASLRALSVEQVPEPSTIYLLVTAVFALLAVWRRIAGS